MVSAKERYERCASIRRHVLLYAKRNDLSELDKALAELKILMDLAELAPAPAERWPTLDETEAEDRAAGRFDEDRIAEYRRQIRDEEEH